MSLFDAIAESGLFAPIDLHLARLLRRRAAPPGADVAALTTALLSRERGRGHSCIELAEWAGRPLHGDGEPGVDLPDREAWEDRLAASGVAGGGDGTTPLVWEGGRLYLRRYWHAEQRVARSLRRRLAGPREELAPEPLAPLFRALFPAASGPGIDWQAVAAAAALASPLALVSGGPGTGKTTTVRRILALLLAADPALRIALAAPTGKAAARLGESIAGGLAALPVDASLAERIPRQASTIHRLLGYLPRSDRFRHDAGRPLASDVVVIDEASMVDLLLMDALLAALPADARLVLLGDRDQLASVETGFVFGDLCAAAPLDGTCSAAFCDFYRRLGGGALEIDPRATPLQDAAVELRISYRFRRQPGIGALARAVRSQDPGRALEILDSPGFDDVDRLPPEAIAEALESIDGDLERYLRADSPAAALERLGRFRILCATRRGPWGVERLNRLVEHRLSRRGLAVGERWYRARAILITANDYQVRLYNGDLGVVWPEDGKLWAWFPAAEAGELRRLPLAKLPAHDTAWAMTVHKSQGSEFDRVLLVLPPEDVALLTRELLYTGVTRARRRLHLVATAEILRRTIARRSRRSSGLVAALLGREARRLPEAEVRAPVTEPVQLSLFGG